MAQHRRGRHRRAASVVLVAGLLAALLTGCGEPAGSEGDRVRVAAASDLRPVLDALVADLAPEVRVEVTYGSSGQLYQQLTNGAPYDVYLSADLALAERLVDDGRTDGDAFAYAVGRLALFSATGLDLSRGLEALADDAVRRVAVANPEHAPYGRAAVAALESAGLRTEVEPKLVLGENVAQAAEFAASGNADAGVVALSLALTPELRRRGEHVEVPAGLFPRIDQGGALLTDAPGAVRLREALLSDAGRELLRRSGFGLPEPR